MKNQENQYVKDIELLIVFSLMVLTFASYGWVSRSIFTSEKISADQAKAEILAYQAAQIFLLKNVEKQPQKGRSLASEGGSLDGFIGEDSSGRPFHYSVIQDSQRSLRVFISKDRDKNGEANDAIFDVKIDLSEATET